MAEKIAVSWGGRVHVAKGQVGQDIVTGCELARPESKLVAKGDWDSCPLVLRCEKCEAYLAELAKPLEVKGQFVALLAEYAQEAAERVGWWDK